jgi:hypothetical protein
LLAVMMPMILAVLGLCVDGVIVVYHRIKLDTSAEAATMSSIAAYDREIWSSQRIVALDEQQGRRLAQEYLSRNLEGAKLVSYNVSPERPNECSAEVEMQVPLFFMKVFGFTEATIKAHSMATGTS